MVQYLKIITIPLLMGLFCISCGGPPTVGISEDVIYNRPMPKIEYEYELGPGDVIEIVYHYTAKSNTQEYYLSVGDVLRVEFTYHEDINRNLPLAMTSGNMGKVIYPSGLTVVSLLCPRSEVVIAVFK